jgi:hypothetical protein
MPLSQKGASYKNQAYIRQLDPKLAEALDDIASQTQTIMTQGNFGKTGTPPAPSAPTAVSAKALNGVFTATINHPNAPAGTTWVFQYSTSSQFTDDSTITTTLAHPVWQASLPQQKLYFRAAAKTGSSPQSAWTYFGSGANPVAVS